MTTPSFDVKSFDVKAFGKVAVVFGGTSNERVVSLMSGEAVLNALQETGIDVHKFDPKEQDIAELTQFDRVFNVLHGRGGEDGELQGLLDWLKIPQTGSGVLASALGMDKVRTKQLWLGCGITETAPFLLLNSEADLNQVVESVGLPVVIKPVHEGSSIGISIVKTEDELKTAYQKAEDCGDIVMAEKFIDGKEFSIVIIDDEAYPVIGCQPAEDAAFYDFDAKYVSEDTQFFIPCGLPEEQESKLQDLCLQAFRAVGASGWGRVDAMQDAEGNFWLLEVNTVPGMTTHSFVPMAAKARGLSFADVCIKILSQTL